MVVAAPSRRYRPSRKGEILAAALDEIAANGFPDTTLAAVANRAGITITAVYYHFDSKLALLVDLVSGIGDEILVAVPPGPGVTSGVGDHLAVMVEALVAWLEDHPAQSQLFFVRAAGVTPEVEALRRGWTNRLALLASERVLAAHPQLDVLTARVIGLTVPTLLEEYVGLWLGEAAPSGAERSGALRLAVLDLRRRFNQFTVAEQD